MPTPTHQPHSTTPQPQSIVQPPFYVDAQHVYLVPPSPSLPRPRKPYTSTKVREMWTPEEHERMLEGLRRHKRDWAKVTQFVGTRSAAQVRSHAQKYFDRVARDKTDDYVPRARPKRKSAAPYPRKAREESAQQMRVQVPAQSPLLNASPIVAQPVQLPYQQVYSPYMMDRPVASPVVPSPVSYVGGYSSPVPQMMHPQQMYGVFSPLTPAYPPNLRSPCVNNAPVSMLPAPHPTHVHTPLPVPHVPTHSHPGGPSDTCAKCMALQRYGTVLQEIGDFRPAPPQYPSTANPVSPKLHDAPPAIVQTSASQQQAADVVRQGTIEVGTKQLDLVGNGVAKNAAHHRALRAKVMKARKAKNKAQAEKQVFRSTVSSGSEPSSESFSPGRKKKAKRSLAEHAAEREQKENGITDVGMKRKDRKQDKGVAKRARLADHNGLTENCVNENECVTERRRKQIRDSEGSDMSPATRVGCEEEENSEQKGASSPRVQVYSRREQKEIFDAVKSLQILAKTPSPSDSESKTE